MFSAENPSFMIPHVIVGPSNTRITQMTLFQFDLMLSEDGSGRGAALVAAVACRER